MSAGGFGRTALSYVVTVLTLNASGHTMRRPTIVMFSRYALALWLVLCAHVGSLRADEPEPYRIQPGDVLMVSVWKEQDLLAEVLVRPDGGMSFPLVGDVRASGRTVDELRTLVDERLSKFIPDPSVTIAIKQIGGNRIYVLGKVSRPGEFAFSQPIDVMQALSLAGGATSFAALDDIQILRRDAAGKQTARRFRYSEVERGRELQQNILLKSGDTVVVP
jgi:polysaccharide export outer membrane protein